MREKFLLRLKNFRRRIPSAYIVFTLKTDKVRESITILIFPQGFTFRDSESANATSFPFLCQIFPTVGTIEIVMGTVLPHNRILSKSFFVTDIY